MSTTETHQVERFYNSIAAGDLPAALRILGDQVEWHEAPGMVYGAEQPYRGAAEVAERVLAPITAHVDALQLHVGELVDLGRSVAVLGRYAGTARGSGHAIDQPFVHIWTLAEDGVVETFRQYTDAERFARTLQA